MERQTIISYLNEIKDLIATGHFIKAFQTLDFVIKCLKAEESYLPPSMRSK